MGNDALAAPDRLLVQSRGREVPVHGVGVLDAVLLNSISARVPTLLSHCSLLK
jgi:hypothetical protein